MPGFETVIYEKKDGVAYITLNRPKALNVYNIKMRDELYQVFGAVREDDEVRVGIIQGAGDRAFCAGADLSEFLTAPPPVFARQARFERDIWGVFLSVPQPIIAALHGYVLGSGLEIALFSDIRIAADNTQFGVPEMGLGIIPAAGASRTLPAVVGRGYASGNAAFRALRQGAGGLAHGTGQPGGAACRPAGEPSKSSPARSRARRRRPFALSRTRSDAGWTWACRRGSNWSPGWRPVRSLPLLRSRRARRKMNTTEFLTITNAICPDKEAIVFESKRFTYSQLNERANRIANALVGLGVEKGSPRGDDAGQHQPVRRGATSASPGRPASTYRSISAPRATS